jgi:creatinine amidohydrolase
MRRLGEMTTTELDEALKQGVCVALVPTGSVEPHGPHLPLATDTLISEGACLASSAALTRAGVTPFLAPAIAYGVTNYADGFAGAISIPADVLTALLRAVIEGYLKQGFAHVCLVNNHLEPAHDAAVRKATEGLDKKQASVACPLTRRWGRTLSAEFKSGACHAGRYETSLVLAHAPALVNQARAAALPKLSISLSDGIKGGLDTFRAMGIDDAYTGAPAEASATEGAELYGHLAAMIAGEVTDALSLSI